MRIAKNLSYLIKQEYKLKTKKKRTDWFDDHIEVIGLTEENNKKIKEKIKKDFIKEFTHKGRKTI